MTFPSRFLPRSFPLAGRRRSRQYKDLTRAFPFFPHLAAPYPIVGEPTERRYTAHSSLSVSTRRSGKNGKTALKSRSGNNLPIPARGKNTGIAREGIEHMTRSDVKEVGDGISV